LRPHGIYRVHLKPFNETYQYEKIFTNVHNLIIGKVYLDHNGNTEIVNTTNGDTARLTFRKVG